MSSRRICHRRECAGGRAAVTLAGRSSSNHRRRKAESVGPARKTSFQCARKSAAISLGRVCKLPRTPRVACTNLPRPGESRESNRRFDARRRCRSISGMLACSSCKRVSSSTAWERASSTAWARTRRRPRPAASVGS
eukprot:1849453-Pyramimonas_sp.AAC.1